MYRTANRRQRPWGWLKDWRRLARSGEILQRSFSAREAALPVYLAGAAVPASIFSFAVCWNCSSTISTRNRRYFMICIASSGARSCYA